MDKVTSALPADMRETVEDIAEGPRQFYKDSVAFLNRCTKPDRKEILKVSQAIGMGFLLMGFTGYIVKLIHIPILNIIVGAS